MRLTRVSGRSDGFSKNEFRKRRRDLLPEIVPLSLAPTTSGESASFGPRIVEDPTPTVREYRKEFERLKSVSANIPSVGDVIDTFKSCPTLVSCRIVFFPTNVISPLTLLSLLLLLPSNNADEALPPFPRRRRPCGRRPRSSHLFSRF